MVAVAISHPGQRIRDILFFHVLSLTYTVVPLRQKIASHTDLLFFPDYYYI